MGTLFQSGKTSNAHKILPILVSKARVCSKVLGRSVPKLMDHLKISGLQLSDASNHFVSFL